MVTDVFNGRDAFLAFIKADETEERTVLAKPVGRLASRYSSILINIKMLYHHCQFFSIELLNTSKEDIEVSTSLLNIFDVKICEDIVNTTINNYPLFIHEYVKSVAHYNILRPFDLSDVEITSTMEYEKYETPFAISRYITEDKDLSYDNGKWLKKFGNSGYQVIPYNSSNTNNSLEFTFKYFRDFYEGITMAYIRNTDKDQDMRQIKQSSSKSLLEEGFISNIFFKSM